MASIEDRIRSIVDALPDDAAVTLPRATLAAWLAESAETVSNDGQGFDPAPSWRALIWECPDATRIGIAELVEAVGKSRAWVYRRTSSNGARHGYGGQPDRIPCHKAGGELVFVASEIREWLRQRERAA